MTLAREGWLGSWGLDPSAPRPPVNGYTIPEMLIDLQPPNSGLTQTIFDNPLSGTHTVSFSWGPTGHLEDGGDPFNFYGIAFVAKQDVVINWGGSFPQFGPQSINTAVADGAISVSSPGITCSVNNEVRYCGEDKFDVWVVTAVPEPQTWMLLIFGLAAIGFVIRQRSATIG